MNQVVAFEDAARVGVDGEDGMIAGVEQDGVGSFGADAVDGEELFAKEGSGSGEHFVERALVMAAQKLDKGFEFAGLLAEIAGRANQLGKTRERNAFERGRGEQFFAAKGDDGFLDVGPAGALGKDGADDDFEASAAGPPVLRTIGLEKCVVVGGQLWERRLGMRRWRGGEVRGAGVGRPGRTLVDGGGRRQNACGWHLFGR